MLTPCYQQIDGEILLEVWQIRFRPPILQVSIVDAITMDLLEIVCLKCELSTQTRIKVTLQRQDFHLGADCEFIYLMQTVN